MKFLLVRSDVCRQLPSDFTLRWTPLLLAMQFPLLGLARDFHPLDNAHAERTKNAISHWEDGKMGKWEKCYKDFSNGHTFSDKQTTANFTPLFLKILQIQQHEAWQTWTSRKRQEKREEKSTKWNHVFYISCYISIYYLFYYIFYCLFGTVGHLGHFCKDFSNNQHSPTARLRQTSHICSWFFATTMTRGMTNADFKWRWIIPVIIFSPLSFSPVGEMKITPLADKWLIIRRLQIIR